MPFNIPSFNIYFGFCFTYVANDEIEYLQWLLIWVRYGTIKFSDFVFPLKQNIHCFLKWRGQIFFQNTFLYWWNNAIVSEEAISYGAMVTGESFFQCVSKNNSIRLCLIQILLILQVFLILEDSGCINSKSDGTYKTEIHMNVTWFNYSKCSMQHRKIKDQQPLQ